MPGFAMTPVHLSNFSERSRDADVQDRGTRLNVEEGVYAWHHVQGSPCSRVCGRALLGPQRQQLFVVRIFAALRSRAAIRATIAASPEACCRSEGGTARQQQQQQCMRDAAFVHLSRSKAALLSELRHAKQLHCRANSNSGNCGAGRGRRYNTETLSAAELCCILVHTLCGALTNALQRAAWPCPTSWS